MTYKEMKDDLKKIYDVADVKEGYVFYTLYLVGKIIKMFDFENLPKDLQARQIMKTLIFNGFCGITKHENEFISVQGNESVNTHYFGDYKKMSWSIPRANGVIIYNENGVLVRANSLKMPLLELVRRYAKMLADIDCTLSMTLVNMRAPFLNVANDDSVASSIKKAVTSLALGKTEVIVNDDIYRGILQLDNNPKTQGNIKELIESKRFVLQSFYNDIGVKMASDKKERMIQTEVDSNNQMLLISITDMLANMQEGFNDFNALYGENVIVKLSKEFDIETVESEVDTVESVDNAESEAEEK